MKKSIRTQLVKSLICLANVTIGMAILYSCQKGETNKTESVETNKEVVQRVEAKAINKSGKLYFWLIQSCELWAGGGKLYS